MQLWKKVNIGMLIIAVAATGIICPAPKAHAAINNLLDNAGFEQDLGGTNAARNWNSEANRGILQIATGAPEGHKMLRLSEPAIALGSPGVFTFQIIPNVNAGDVVTFNGLVRANVLDPGDAGQVRIEFQTAAGVAISAIDTSVSAVSASFARTVVSGIAPAGTGQAVAVLRIQPSAVGGTSIVDYDDMQFTANASPLFLEAAPASTSGVKGDMKMIALRLHNLSGTSLAGVEVVAEPPDGINIRPEGGNVDGRAINHREGSVIFSVGGMTPGQESVLSFPIIITSIAQPGKSYDLTLYAKSATGENSQTVHILVRVENDPVFDEGTIIGKVFNDTNQNGIQDGCTGEDADEKCAEPGVPWVRLATEEGIVIITDEHGRYHLPGVKPGRHVVKIDGHTLPEGTKFITEESYLVKVTEGLMAKANFGVLIPPSEIPKQFSQELMVSLTQGLDTSRPDLGITMTPDVLRVGVKRFEKEPVFSFKMNYPEYVKNWFLEIRDEMGHPLWTGFGLGAPPGEVVWSGQLENGEFIHPGVYSYQLKVEDQKGYQDWTPLHFFRVIDKQRNYNPNMMTEIPPIGDFNIFKDGKRTIPLVAKPTIQIQGKTKKENKIQINGYPVDVDQENGMFSTQIYTTPGDKEITVTSTTPEGENLSVVKKIKVKDSTFFMVALAEGEGGMNFNRGNVESVGREASFKESFFEDGRMSYYLKGKLKGKFLFTSHYDTDDKRSALFTNLDQDKYYPIYGDNSTRNYEARDTMERFYMVVEMERSFAKYGSFKTEFNDTELSSYNRTLSGLKVHHESLSTTPYGDPKRGFKVFWAEARHKADHNEFAATGGSLYYLRNRQVIEGSEKIRVEVRDKIQNITVESIDLQEGVDYDINYEEGRLILTKPLSSIAASDTLVNYDILDGNPVFLIVDYEFDAGASAFEDTNRGLRGYTHVGDHIKIGATGVEEKRQVGDYDLRGVDMTMKVGRNSKVTAEYAESKLQQTNTSVSYNGGLSFADTHPLSSPNTTTRENAYLIKGETKPIKNLDSSAYIQGVDPGFSNDHIGSQEGFRKYGFANKLKLSDDFYLRQRFDVSDVANELNPPSIIGVTLPYERLRTNTVQAIYDDHKYLAELEYRHQIVDIPEDVLSPTFLSEIPFRDGIATKLGYHLNDKLLPYLRGQVGFNDKPNHSIGAGVRYQITNSLFGYIEQMIGNIGDSTRFGFEKYRDNTRSYASIKMLDFGDGIKNFATTIGNSRSLSDRSRIYSEREYSSYHGLQDGYADILGYDKQINENWGFSAKGERRHLDQSTTRLLDDQAARSLTRTNTFNTISGGVTYRSGSKLKARSSLEFRKDQDEPELAQWLTRNNLEYHFNEDLSFLGKFDFGRSRFLEPGNTSAAFGEFSTGLAYRPVDNDRLNVLSRYTMLRNFGNDLQYQNALFQGVTSDQTDHILAIDLAYDWHRYLGTVEKFAYKHSTLNPNVANEIILHHLLLLHRFNFHVTRKWDLGLEYRMLWQFDAAQTLKHGALTELDREIYDYVRLGLGYNFTDFDDDLRHSNNLRSHGPFVRMTGKF